jgi:sugar fermentation stimulation protein A
LIFENIICGTFVKRYNRFLVDVLLDDGQQVTAHCPNTGSMGGILIPGAPVVLTPSKNPASKLKYVWQMVQVDHVWVGVNTQNPNSIVNEALEKGLIDPLRAYPEVRKEVKIGADSRIDFCLKGEAGLFYLEVKNVHLCRSPGICEFPDSVTTRGLKHLHHLIEFQEMGIPCGILFLCQRNDVLAFRAAMDIDPAFAEGLKACQKAGVSVMAYNCHLSPQAIEWGERMRVQ